MGANSFNEMEIDAIGEIMNISLGASATAVSTMLGTAVNITTPVVRILAGSEFEFKKLEPAVGVEIAYVKGLDGRNIMMFSRNDVRIIVGMMMGEEIPPDQFELDEMNRSAICEVMNQMMGSSATALAEFLGIPVDISTPVSFEIESDTVFKEKYFPENCSRVVVRFSLEIEGQLKSEFFNIMSEDLVKRLLEPFQVSLDVSVPPAREAEKEEPAAASGATMSQAEIEAMMAASQPAAEPAAAPGATMSQAEIEAMMAASQPAAEPAAASGATMSQAEIEAMMAASQPAAPAPAPVPVPPVQSAPVYAAPQAVYQAAQDPMMLQLLNQMQQSQMQMMELMQSMRENNKAKETKKSSEPSLIRPMSSPVLEDEAGDGQENRTNQEMLMKVPLEISVEIGRTKKLVKDILEFTQGSLVVLDKMAGEQADLYVNGECIARGDIVVVEDNFGIRITEIVARNLIPECL